MVMNSAGVYVAQIEDLIYDDPDWEWVEVSQFLEEGRAACGNPPQGP
jgi:hypothetical protein